MNEAIAAGHELTAETAFDVLKDGGNAVDAAIAAYLVSFIAEPCMASVGGGAFALVAGKNGTSRLFDFFCETPRTKRSVNEQEFFPVTVDFGTAREDYYVGMGSIAVPGSIAGIFALHEHYGSIPMKVLVQPAVKAAAEGVAINNFQYLDLGLLQEIFLREPYGKKHFGRDHRLIRVGEILTLPELADFLDYMSREGRDSFYRGEAARNLVADCADRGGHLTMEDLENYRVKTREPLKVPFYGHRVLCNPFPSIGGALMALGAYEIQRQDIGNKFGQVNHLQGLYRSFEQMNALERDPAAIEPVLKKAQINYSPDNHSRGSTSHISVMDRWGNAVSLTMTIGEGSGYFIPGTGIHMNNMLGEIALMPDGYHSWVENRRLSSMMNPTVVLDEKNHPELVTGSGGAARIPYVLLQLMLNIFYFSLPLEEATLAPRAYLDKEFYHLEPGFDPDILNQLTAYNVKNWSERSLFFGGAHTVLRKGKREQAVGDIRRDGVAKVSGL